MKRVINDVLPTATESAGQGERKDSYMALPLCSPRNTNLYRTSEHMRFLGVAGGGSLLEFLQRVRIRPYC